MATAAPPIDKNLALKTALDGVRAADLRRHVSALAADSLAGRSTPSAGLNAAARYLAQQFTTMGLAPVGDDGFFQTSTMDAVTFSQEPHRLVLTHAGKRLVLTLPQFSLRSPVPQPVSIQSAPVILLTDVDQIPAHPNDAPAVWVGHASDLEPPTWSTVLAESSGSALVILDDGGKIGPCRQIFAESAVLSATKPLVFVSDTGFIDAFSECSAGRVRGMTIDIELPAWKQVDVPVYNVVGMWPPPEQDTPRDTLIVSAHYDHVGDGRCDGVPRGFFDQDDRGDWIWNGANDNASGVASMLEVAESLAESNAVFRHAVLFVAFFGEEIGLKGSTCYVEHPVVPLSRTLGQINLEQTGRLDDRYRPSDVEPGTPCVTGYGYSTLTDTLKRAGREQGIGLYAHPYLSDMLFLASDNAPFARAGVPAHTVCLALHYADYHGAGDHADRLDYAAMERFTRMILRAVWMQVRDPVAPAWTERPETKAYRAAQSKRSAALTPMHRDGR